MISSKAASFTESIIRDMTRLANAHGAINLAQGFPDFPAPEVIKRAAIEAIERDINQYAVTWGTKGFRDAIAARAAKRYGMVIDPDTQVTVTCGATEAMIAAQMAIVDPGDEVIVFEPFYENYGPDAILSGATPRFVQLHEPDWSFDPAELAAAFNDRTKAIIINTPNNPTGKVFTRAELDAIAELCIRWGAIAITDEIYDEMTYDGIEHVPMLSIPGMEDRTILINGMSKTYAVTGWRVGWTFASPEVTGAIRKVHDFLTVGAPAPMQEAGVVALELPDSYYDELRAAYTERRDVMLEALQRVGFSVQAPAGAYYLMCDSTPLGLPESREAARILTADAGVACVPGAAFYRDPADGASKLRFSFCKRVPTLTDARDRLLTWRG